MGEFTDDDRKMLVETHTLVRGIVNDVNDHEKRIRLVEKISLIWAAGVTGISGMIAKFVANGGGG